MSPTSRNTMLIGGALIVVALLLTCGPMTNWFGTGDGGASTTPDVAAGPPAGNVNATGSLAAATAGALAGGQAGSADAAAMDLKERCDRERQRLLEAGLDLDTLDPDCDGIGGGTAANRGAAGAAVAVAGAGIGSGAAGSSSGAGAAGSSAGAAGAGAVGAAGLAAGTGAAIAGTSGGGGSSAGPGPAGAATSALPPVSAGFPDTQVGNLSGVSPAAVLAAAAATAAGAFDESFGSDAVEGASPAAGRVVDRFAPPVAAVGGGTAFASNGGALGIQAGGVRVSCDSPGAGCSSLRAGSGGGSTPRVPPIVGGTRPNRNPQSTN